MTKELQNGVFPGRFQPMTRSHVEIVETLVRNSKPEKLVIAIPETKTQNQANPFSGDQALMIVRLSLDEAGLEWVEASLVDMSKGLIEAWRKQMKENEIDMVFTGNEKMASLVNFVSLGLGLKTKAMCFGDGTIGKIRATEVRRQICAREPEWKGLVMPSAASYIESLPINYNELPEARTKRAWSFLTQ